MEMLPVMRKCFISSTVLLMAASLQGDWLFLYLNFRKQMDSSWSRNDTVYHSLEQFSSYFKDFPTIWLASCLVGYGMYFGVGGFLHYYFYIGKRDSPEEWKCQPTKWLPRDLELDAIKIGCLSLLSSGTLSALVVTYIVNGGPCMVYWRMDEYSWIWWFLQWPVIFIYQDYSTYWNHRLYHTPFLYKHFHKVHHKYRQPTVFSVTAIHPVEMMHIQICLMLPLFVIPVHYVPFQSIAIYTFYHGIIVHSGVDLKAFWWQPWQPDPMFHDNHHQYFHVNFAFNIFLWDKIHGTYRKKDRIYREYLFSGKGKAITEATKEELLEEIEEREAENVKAYRKTGYEKEFAEPGRPLVESELVKRT